MRPIFNIFFWIKWRGSHEQYINSTRIVLNSDICLLPPWNVWKQKRKKEKNTLQDSAENAESKRTLYFPHFLIDAGPFG